MNLILAILLYIGVISPNGTYYQSYITNQESINATLIEIIENDPITMTVVDGVCGPEVSGITIIDEPGG